MEPQQQQPVPDPAVDTGHDLCGGGWQVLVTSRILDLPHAARHTHQLSMVALRLHPEFGWDGEFIAANHVFVVHVMVFVMFVRQHGITNKV